MNIETYIRDMSFKSIVLGEYVTPDGPLWDDHFLVLIDSELEVHEYSLESSECNDVIEHLEKTIGVKIAFKLCDKTNYESRVIHPNNLVHEKLFIFTETSAKDGFWAKLFAKRTLLKKINPSLISYIVGNPKENTTNPTAPSESAPAKTPEKEE